MQLIKKYLTPDPPPGGVNPTDPPPVGGGKPKPTIEDEDPKDDQGDN